MERLKCLVCRMIRVERVIVEYGFQVPYCIHYCFFAGKKFSFTAEPVTGVIRAVFLGIDMPDGDKEDFRPRIMDIAHDGHWIIQLHSPVFCGR